MTLWTNVVYETNNSEKERDAMSAIPSIAKLVILMPKRRLKKEKHN